MNHSRANVGSRRIERPAGAGCAVGAVIGRTVLGPSSPGGGRKVRAGSPVVPFRPKARRRTLSR
jgi:hypothetical protein